MQIFHYGNLSASTVLIQPVDDHDLEEMETELNEIRKQGQGRLSVDCGESGQLESAIFRPGKRRQSLAEEGFGDGAGELLQFLLGAMCGSQQNVLYRWIFAGGIILSLGGISDGYHLQVLQQLSPSVWFPEFPAIYEGTRCESKCRSI